MSGMPAWPAGASCRSSGGPAVVAHMGHACWGQEAACPAAEALAGKPQTPPDTLAAAEQGLLPPCEPCTTVHLTWCLHIY